MEALVTLITVVGFVSSVSLCAWGLGLCLRHGFKPATTEWAA